MWGLTCAYGYGGDLELAASTAAEGVEIALEAGDIWLVALTSLALGASHVLAGKPNVSIAILTRALGAFRECNDTFGRTACRLWLALAYLDMERGVPWANVERASSVMLRDAEVHGVGERHGGAMSHFLTSADDLLALCETNGYNFLFTGPTLLGPPDERRLVPLMLEARAHHIRPAYVGRLLALAGLPDIQVHPGYQLRVQMLGAFRVWRGEAEIAPREWQRDKARQLFQLLLTERGRWLQRDEIVDRLWPSLGPDAALRDFKVALNALNRAIEPGHHPDDPFAFVAREGTAYRVRPEADLWVDAIEFEAVCEAGLHGPLSGSGTEETLAICAPRCASTPAITCPRRCTMTGRPRLASACSPSTSALPTGWPARSSTVASTKKR